MNISSNTLFHFTNNRDTLESILINNFWPTLCIEKNNILSRKFSTWAIPMVCFCDIPLGNIEKHMSKYGNYAIGLKYDWARKNGINPVWYIKNNSNAANNLKEFYKGEGFDSLTKEDGSSKGNKLIFNLFYTKRFSTLEKNPHPLKNKTIRFYDEREWRYIPYLFERGKRLYLTGNEYNEETRKNEINAILRSNPLCFTPSDINYIIIRRDSELLEMKHSLERIKGEYSYEDREILVTKLLSTQRIKNDF